MMDSTFAVLEEALAFAFRLCPIDLLELKAMNIDVRELGSCLSFAEANLGDLRIGEDGPGNSLADTLLGSRQQRVARGDISLPPRVVRELEAPGRVPGSVDTRVGCAQVVVNVDGSVANFDASLLQVQFRDARPASGRQK